MPLDRLADLPTWALSRANHRAQRILHRALAEAGGHGYHYRMLSAIDQHTALSQADLGRLVVLDRKDVATELSVLERAGFVHREPDPADKRRNVVRVTAAGAAELERLHAVVMAAQAQVIAPLSEQERRLLLTLLARLHDPADR